MITIRGKVIDVTKLLMSVPFMNGMIVIVDTLSPMIVELSALSLISFSVPED